MNPHGLKSACLHATHRQAARKTGRVPGDARFALLLIPAVLLTGLAPACKRQDDSSGGPKTSQRVGAAIFTDVTISAGIKHRHHKPVLDRKLDNIMSWVASVGAAACAGDFDNDGWIDLYVTDSRKGTPNYLYRNNRDGTFTDVAVQARVAAFNGGHGTSMDCVWGDFDHDGWIDLYLVRWGRDVLLRNRGDGTFAEATEKVFRRPDGASGTPWANGNAAIWFDFNLDGRLDLYVGNYFDEVDLWNLKDTRIMHDDFERARNGGRNFLYRQEPDGTFTEIAEPLGVDDPGWTLAVGSADVNNDGWPDLYCADDFGPDQLFLNRRGARFDNVSDATIGFDTKKGMNVDFGDFNNDGWLDIYVTNITTAEYLQEGNMLWHNNGPGDNGVVTFTDVSLETGTYDGGWGWGAKFFDFDHDGRLDILSVNGFISAGKGNYWYDLASWTVTGADPADAGNWPTIGNRSFSGYEYARLWRNDNLASFTELARQAGLETNGDGRGLVLFDFDNDGDLDVFIANQGQPPNLFRNDTVRFSSTTARSAERTRTAGSAVRTAGKSEPKRRSRGPSRDRRGAAYASTDPQPPNGDAVSSRGRNWLMIQLEGNPRTGSNRDAIGTRVTVVTDAGIQIRERDGGSGYSGQSDPRLHFGLGGDDRVRLLEVRWPDGGLQYLENVAANQLLRLRQDPATYTEKLAVEISLPKPWTPPSSPPASKPAASSSADIPARWTEMQQQNESEKFALLVMSEATELESLLADMEDRLRQRPRGFALASEYRKRCAANGRHDRAIHFFRRMVADAPDDARARIELACALVDKIPTCGGIAAIVSKGTLARQSLDQLDKVIAGHEDLWVANYCRGMNHLHWPRALLHSDDAAADFRRCIELQTRNRPAGESPAADPPDHYVRAYVGLGDALTKAKRYSQARRAWRDGQALFPDSDELKVRLSIPNDRELLSFVESQRSLERPIDTSLSFLDAHETAD